MLAACASVVPLPVIWPAPAAHTTAFVPTSAFSAPPPRSPLPVCGGGSTDHPLVKDPAGVSACPSQSPNVTCTCFVLEVSFSNAYIGAKLRRRCMCDVFRLQSCWSPSCDHGLGDGHVLLREQHQEHAISLCPELVVGVWVLRFITGRSLTFRTWLFYPQLFVSTRLVRSIYPQRLVYRGHRCAFILLYHT